MTQERDTKLDMEAIVLELQEANRWLRVLALPILKERLEAELKTPTDRKIYQASTGGSQREVAKAIGGSHMKVARSWARWAAAGVMAPTTTGGRFVRLVDLETVGLGG